MLGLTELGNNYLCKIIKTPISGKQPEYRYTFQLNEKQIWLRATLFKLLFDFIILNYDQNQIKNYLDSTVDKWWSDWILSLNYDEYTTLHYNLLISCVNLSDLKNNIFLENNICCENLFFSGLIKICQFFKINVTIAIVHEIILEKYCIIRYHSNIYDIPECSSVFEFAWNQIDNKYESIEIVQNSLNLEPQFTATHTTHPMIISYLYKNIIHDITRTVENIESDIAKTNSKRARNDFVIKTNSDVLTYQRKYSLIIGNYLQKAEYLFNIAPNFNDFCLLDNELHTLRNQLMSSYYKLIE